MKIAVRILKEELEKCEKSLSYWKKELKSHQEKVKLYSNIIEKTEKQVLEIKEAINENQ